MYSNRRHLTVLVTVLLPIAITPPSAIAQAGKPPASTVVIENTNADYKPSQETVPQANPTRPTVTNSAHLIPTAYFQFEQGINRADRSPAGIAGQTSLLQTTKVSLNTFVQLQFITEPYAYSTVVQSDSSSLQTNDPGDLILGVQVVLFKAAGPIPSIAAGYLHRVRTGTAPNIDLGGYSQSLVLLFGGDLPANFHYDANILFNEQNDGPIRRLQTGQTLAVSHPLFAKKSHFSGIAELSHFTQPLTSDTFRGAPVTHAHAFDLLFASTWSARPNLIFDAALVHGLTSTSTQWQETIGFTYLLPRRLWPDRHPVPHPKTSTP